MIHHRLLLHRIFI